MTRWLRNAYKIPLQVGRISLNFKQMKSLLLIALATAAVFSTSCNTFIGMGRDIRLAGEGMETAANKSSGGNSNSGGDTSVAPVY